MEKVIMKQPKIINLAILFAALFLINGCDKEPIEAESKLGADLVMFNGSIYTVDETHSWAQAIAIKDGRIIYVGPDAGINEFLGADTQVIDLQNKMVMPGMQDVHIHPIMSGIQASTVDLSNFETVAEYRTVISNYANANPEVEWILGGGWSMGAFGPGALANRKIIDELVSDRPVYLGSRDGHSGWANSLALEIAGITKDTPNPIDGIIDRDPESGELIGSLQEGAMMLMESMVPAQTMETRKTGLRYAIDLLNSYGITAMQDAALNGIGISSSLDAVDLKAYHSLEASGELTMRVVGSHWWARDQGIEQLLHFKELRAKYTSKLVKPTTVKIMQDGVMENYTAVLLEPYHVPSQTKGIPMVEPEFLKKIVTAIDAAGFQVHFHAIGDGAVRQTLDAVEESIYENGRLGNRHHISHLQLIHPDDFGRFAELDVVANFQPLWAYKDIYIDDLTAPFLGEERMKLMYPIKSIQEAGGMIAFGSDWFVSTPNPFPQMETAVTRQGATGILKEPLLIEESIDLESAIDAFTINAAFVNNLEKETGSIEVGKYADLVVLDQNLFEIEVYDISETKALLTLFEGRVVHGSVEEL
jgi:predicted amidohydrolase YtcJ